MLSVKGFILIILFGTLPSCFKSSSDQPPQSLLQDHGSQAWNRAAQDKVSETNFREIFAALLAESGASSKDISQAIFDTPQALLLPPTQTGVGKAANLNSIDEFYLPHTPEEAYEQGLSNPPQQRSLKPGKGPVTLIVFPGFTSEFIAFDPFEEVLANQESLFAKKMVPILATITDDVYQVKEQKQVSAKMSELVRVASFDRKGLPWVNIMVLTPKLGSLESIGTVRAGTEIYKRRLHKILHQTRGVNSLGEIYLLGFSRGVVVALDFLKHMSLQPTNNYPWFQRVRGMVSLGGPIYGSHIPDRALSGDHSEDAQTVQILRRFISDIVAEPPSDLKGQAYAQEAARRVSKNMATWTRLIQEINGIGKNSKSKSSAQILMAQEEALRHIDHAPEKAGIIANFDTFKAILFDLLALQCPIQNYFKNIKAFKQILTEFLDGLGELTTENRLRWWNEANLPRHFRLLSLTATMPGPPVNGTLSPLLLSPYIGYRSPDFISRLRPGYYSSLEAGAGALNDSSVSVARGRYWPQLDSVSGRRHDYLGIIGAHHYGMAFPYAVADKNRTPNPFPRAILLAAIGSYLREYPFGEPKPTKH